MAEDNESVVAQARFWAAEYRRRFPVAVAGALSPSAYYEALHALERHGGAVEVWITDPLPHVAGLVRARHELAPSEPFRMPPTDHISEDVFYFPPVCVYELADVTLDVDSGVLFSGQLVMNGSGNCLRSARDSAFITGATVRNRKLTHRPEGRMVASITNLNQHYHLLMETVPQILRVKQVVPDVTFITSDRPAPTSRSVLDALDITVEFVPPNSVLDCTRVAFYRVPPRGRTHPADMQLLVDTFVDAERHADATEKVYISRRHSDRAFTNEARLESWLEERGFRTVRLETMTFPEQVSLLASTRVVVAPHGAGLANTVFMPRGGRVIELSTGEWWDRGFRRIAHSRGLDHSLVLLPSTPGDRWGSAAEAIDLLTPILDGEPAAG